MSISDLNRKDSYIADVISTRYCGFVALMNIAVKDYVDATRSLDHVIRGNDCGLRPS